MTHKDPNRRDAIVDAILAFEAEYGHPPTVRDLMDQVHLASPSTVHFHLRKLVDAGVLYGCRCGCGRYRVAA